MNILTLENITKVYTQRKLFDGASFYMHDGEKVGLIGINGTGKSTLLKICAGVEEPDSGNVIRASNQVVGYLPQHPVFEKDTDIITCICGRNAETDQITKARTMLTQLGFSDFGETADHMSGGQQKRLALVSVLMNPCDILLLLFERAIFFQCRICFPLANEEYRGCLFFLFLYYTRAF